MLRLPITYLIPVVKSLPPALQERFLSQNGLSMQDLYAADGKVAVDRYDALIKESAELTGNPGIGLIQGSLVDLRQLGLVAFVLMNAATVREAFGYFQRYNTLVCTGIAYEVEDDSPTLFRFVSTAPGRVVPAAVWDSVLVSFLHLLRQLTDRPVSVLAATLPHEPTVRAHREALGIVPRRTDEASLTVAPEVLDRRIAFADPALLAQFRGRADALLSAFPEVQTSQRLRRVLTDRWGRSQHLEVAARELAMGVRTLQQHLKTEGTTFQEVLDDLRREFASAELRRPEHSIGEIAWLLGYSEQSVFQAAFKRWTGMTPLAYRRGAHEARSTNAITGRS